MKFCFNGCSFTVGEGFDAGDRDLYVYDRLLEKNVKTVFVNGLLHWYDDLIKPLNTDLHNSLSDYSKQLLDFDHRDDDEIQRFFETLQKKFATLDRNLWVNLFDPWIRNIIDKGPLGHHPGVLSNQLMADKTAEYFIKNQII